MNTPQKAAQTVNTFINLLKELTPFIETKDIRLAFDAKGNSYLQGINFSQRLEANPELWRLVSKEMRDILAEHAPRISVDQFRDAATAPDA